MRLNAASPLRLRFTPRKYCGARPHARRMFKKKEAAPAFSGLGAAGGAAGGANAIQRDWEEREFGGSIQLGVTQLAAFLNEFESATRSKLAALNGKLTRVERRMQVIEATLRSVDQEDA